MTIGTVAAQLFERRVLSMAKPERARVFEGAAGLAAPVFGIERASVAPIGADPVFAALHGLYWLTAALAESRPLLPSSTISTGPPRPSLRWVAYAAHRLDGLPVAILLTSRPREHNREALASLSGDQAVTVLRPAPLSAAAVERVVRARLPDAAVEFCAACHDATAGNPFFLRELLDTVHGGELPVTASAAASVGELDEGRDGSRSGISPPSPRADNVLYPR